MPALSSPTTATPDTEASADNRPAKGGGGALFARERNLRSDLQLLQQAILERWEIPAAAFRALPAEVIRIAFDSHLNTRVRLRAMEVLLTMNRQNTPPTPPLKGITDADS